MIYKWGTIWYQNLIVPFLISYINIFVLASFWDSLWKFLQIFISHFKFEVFCFCLRWHCFLYIFWCIVRGKLTILFVLLLRIHSWSSIRQTFEANANYTKTRLANRSSSSTTVWKWCGTNHIRAWCRKTSCHGDKNNMETLIEEAAQAICSILSNREQIKVIENAVKDIKDESPKQLHSSEVIFDQLHKPEKVG